MKKLKLPTSVKTIQAPHVIAAYKVRENQITCTCEFVGTVEEFEKHRIEQQKLSGKTRIKNGRSPTFIS